MRELLIAAALALLVVLGILLLRSAPAPADATARLDSVLAEARLVAADGQAVPVERLQGQPVRLLYVSASWCPPCQAFTPALLAFHEAHQPSVAVLLVGADDSPAAMQAYMQAHAMPWPAVARDDAATMQALQGAWPVSGIPALLAFDGEGRLVIDGRGRDPRGVLREVAARLE